MFTLLAATNVTTFDDIFKSSFLEKTATFSLIDALIGLASAFYSASLFTSYTKRRLTELSTLILSTFH